LSVRCLTFPVGLNTDRCSSRRMGHFAEDTPGLRPGSKLGRASSGCCDTRWMGSESDHCFRSGCYRSSCGRVGGAMLTQRKPSPQPETAVLTSFDQDWKNVGSYFLTYDLRSNSLGLRFAWVWSTWTNTALFLPYIFFIVANSHGARIVLALDKQFHNPLLFSPFSIVHDSSCQGRCLVVLGCFPFDILRWCQELGEPVESHHQVLVALNDSPY
jgi:hypothetical protein